MAAMDHPFDAACALQADGRGQYLGHSSDAYWNMAGPFGGTRVVETSLPVLRELGLVTIFWDVNVGGVGKVFDQSGNLLDEAFVRRTDKFLAELIWMAKALRYGRESIALN